MSYSVSSVGHALAIMHAQSRCGICDGSCPLHYPSTVYRCGYLAGLAQAYLDRYPEAVQAYRDKYPDDGLIYDIVPGRAYNLGGDCVAVN